MFTEGLRRLHDDTRPRMFGEDGLWYYKRGEARVRLRRHADAIADLKQALSVETQAWVKGRTYLELGKAADLAGDRARGAHRVRPLPAIVRSRERRRGGRTGAQPAGNAVPGTLRSRNARPAGVVAECCRRLGSPVR